MLVRVLLFVPLIVLAFFACLLYSLMEILSEVPSMFQKIINEQHRQDTVKHLRLMIKMYKDMED